MASPPVASYLLGSESVLRAGRRMRRVLEDDGRGLEGAITSLETAADDQERGSERYRTRLFAQVEPADARPSTPRQSMEEALGTVLVDISVGNVLIAAGEAAGEAGESGRDAPLDEAIRQLDTAHRKFAESVGSGGVGPGRRFSFSGAVSVERPASANMSSAIDSFRGAAENSLSILLEETSRVASSVFGALVNLDQTQVGQALSKLGADVGLPKVGRLIRRGLAKIENAIRALLRLFGPEAFKTVRAAVGRLWERAAKGEFTRQALEVLFGADDIRHRVDRAAAFDKVPIERYDAATAALGSLAPAVKEGMARLQAISVAVGFVGSIVNLTPLAGQVATLALAGAYASLVGAAVLIGLDYAGNRDVLKRVRGIAEIADEVSVAHAR